jgi:hypothetical protein
LHTSIHVQTNACQHPAFKLFPVKENYRNLKIQIYINTVFSFPAVLYGYETWTSTLREEQRLNLWVNTLLRKICGHKRDEVAEGSGEYCITRGFMVCTPHQVLLG